MSFFYEEAASFVERRAVGRIGSVISRTEAVGVGHEPPTVRVYRVVCGSCVPEPGGAICRRSIQTVLLAGGGCGCGRNSVSGCGLGGNCWRRWTSASCWTGRRHFWMQLLSPRKRGPRRRHDTSRERYEVHGGGRRPGHTECTTPSLLSTPICAFRPKWRVGQGNFPLSRSQIRTWHSRVIRLPLSSHIPNDTPVMKQPRFGILHLAQPLRTAPLSSR
jgi:hypothetical protein